jgi:hypothetical protein
MRKNRRRRRSGEVAAWLVLIALAGWGSGCKSSRHPGVGTISDAAADHGGNPGVDGGGGAVGSDGGGATGDVPADGARPGPEAGGADGGDEAGIDGAPAGGDAAPDGDAGFGAGCNTLTPGAPVTVVCAGDGGGAPNPAGGTIADGTYVLTSITALGPCIVLDVAQTLVITGTTIQTVVEDSITGVARGNSTYTVSGAGVFSQLMETNTCPDTMARAFGYTAAGNTLTLYSNDSGTITVAVLTRQ